MILEVAETPLIVVVRTFPVEDCVKVSIIFTKAEEIPFTIVVKVFVEVETEFVITTVAVAVLVAKTILPFSSTVKNLFVPVAALLLDVMFKLREPATDKFVPVAFVKFILVAVALFVMRPLEVLLPFESTLKSVFSTQPKPFQNKVELVAVPFVSEPDIFVQNVDEPFVDKTCPRDPALFVESKSFPNIFRSVDCSVLKIGLSLNA
jgi:hypothetical protein